MTPRFPGPRLFVWLLALATDLLLTAALLGQTTGRIEGRVVDGAGQPLPGVTVTAGGAALQGGRTAVTASDGAFRFAALSPGIYRVEAELSGFNPLETSEVRVGLDRTATLEMRLTPVHGEAIVVTGEAPAIDLASTTSGARYSDQLIRSLPTARTFQSLAYTAPGVSGGGIADSPSVRGASAAENRYIVNGLDVTDPAFGTSQSSLAFEFIQEIEVKTGGYQAEYSGALGGVLNVVTKSGGNELHGDVFGYFSDQSLQAQAPATEEFGQNLGFTKYDYGFDLGGKILQDRLWYFAALNPSATDDDFLNRQDLPFTESTRRLYYAGKLTWQAGPGVQTVLSAFGDPATLDGIEPRNEAGHAPTDLERGAYSYALGATATPSSRWFLDLAAGYYDQRDTGAPVYPQTPGYVDYTGTGFWATQQNCGNPDLISDGGGVFFGPGCQGGGFVNDSGRTRTQVRASGNWFAGAHDVKGGLEYRHNRYGDDSHYSGPFAGPVLDSNGQLVTESLAGGIFYLYDDYYELWDYRQNSVGTTDELGLYVQDQWRIFPSLTLSLGARLDSFQSTGAATRTQPDRQLDFNFGDMIAPRVGFVWDVFRNGRSRLFGNFARYYESVPLDINVRAFGAEQYDIYFFAYPENGALPAYANLGADQGSFTFGTGVGVDPDLRPMYSDELSFGFEYELSPGFIAGVKWVERKLNNVVEDISADGGSTYFITNPGGVYTVNPVTGEPLETPAVFPEAVRDYQAVEVTANKSFGKGWQVAGSYVWSQNKGNYGGLYRQDNTQLDPNITTAFDIPEMMLGAYGLLPNDRTHQVKAYGSYTSSFGLVAGFLGQWSSGTPLSKLGSQTLYGVNERFVTPRGTAGRTPSIWSLDLHLAYPIRVGSGVAVNVIADLFNVANNQKPVIVDETWTYAALDRTVDPRECGGPGTGPGTNCPEGNPFWGSAVAYQLPRSLRLGLKVSW